jgi:16S rRNA processing protein RimM
LIKEDYLRTGKILGAHGLKGFLKVLIISNIDDRFSEGNQVFIKEGSSYSMRMITSSQEFKRKIALVKLEGIDDRDSAMLFSGKELFIDKKTAVETRGSLESDSFYYFDIIDCSVYLDGSEFGKVVDIVEAGSGEILVIKDKTGMEHMVPFIKSMVDTGGLPDKRIDIHPVEGLLD